MRLYEIFTNRFVLIFLALTLSLLACSSSTSQPTALSDSPSSNSQSVTPAELLIGNWQGGDSTTNGDITFGSDGRVTMHQGNSIQQGSYTVDFSFNPAHIDFHWDSGIQSNAQTIIEFIDDNTIRIENITVPDESRPTAFSKFITLTRIAK